MKSKPMSEVDRSISYFNIIPNEIIVEIFHHLDWKSLVRSSGVCKLWYEECKREKLWEKLCIKMFGITTDNQFIRYLLDARNYQWILRSRVTELKHDDHKSKIGFMIYPNGDRFFRAVFNLTRYEGEWKDNKRNGLGILYMGNETSVGRFVSDRQEGTALIMSKNGHKYEGECSRDLRHGKGKYSWPNGDTFDGEFNSDMRHGFGVYTWASGDRFEGYFENNLKNGPGTFYHINGDKFEGLYVAGKRNGIGMYTWHQGAVYIGVYKDESKEGHGVFRYAHGGVYSGGYMNDKRHGKGCFTWPDGDKYVGIWEAERRRGPGTLYCSSGHVHNLVWNELDNANYAFGLPDKFPSPDNSQS